MTFTKTSQKFGQWSDVRANTVYGLGFASEAELGKVCIYTLVAIYSKIFPYSILSEEVLFINSLSKNFTR